MNACVSKLSTNTDPGISFSSPFMKSASSRAKGPVHFTSVSEFQPKLSLLLSPPPTYLSLFKNQAPSKVKCHRTAFCRDQTVTERPVRPRVSAPTIMYIRAYVYLCHTPVTLIKSTYYSILIRILGTSYRTLLRSIVNNMANNLTRLTDHKYSGCNKRQYSEPTTILFNIWKINENF